MGTSGWDDDARGRGRSSRDARPREGERLPGRSSERGGYDYDRSERGGSRVRSRDDGWSDTDRSRSYARREERDYDRGPGGPGNSSGRNRRPARDDYDESADYSGRNGRDMRGPRSPQPREAWESPQRRGPGNSGVRSNSSGRSGLWDDDADARGRRPGRPGGSDPRGRGVGGGRLDPRDPRALRRGLVSERRALEETPEKGMGCGPAILVVLLMFMVGVGGGFAAFKMTAPKINVDTTMPAPTTTPATTPSVTPKASPSATPKADAPHIWVASNASYGI